MKRSKMKKQPAKKRPKHKAGSCRVCGCTEDRACIDVDRMPCSWANRDRDLCSKCARVMVYPRTDVDEQYFADRLAANGAGEQLLLLGAIVEHLIDENRILRASASLF
jgi:hypothetical protein